MSAPAPAVVKISSAAADIVAAVPHFVGFHPKESLVAVSLRGPRKRSGLTIRIDLPRPADHQAMAHELTRRLRHDRARAALLVCYTAQADEAGVLPRRDLVDRQVAALLDAHIEVADALLVRDERWWCYHCTQGCCPPEGTPLPSRPQGAGARLAAEAVVRGQVVLADRGELEAGVRGPQALRLIFLERAYDERGADFARELRTDRRAADERTQALVRELLARRAGGDGAISDAEAVQVVMGLHTKTSRDEVMTWLLDGDPDIYQEVFGVLCRAAIDDLCAPVCTVLAIAAYAAGNGARANVALERALAADPDYPMGRLLRDALDRQVAPSTLRRTLRDVSADLARGTGRLTTAPIRRAKVP